LFRNSLISVPTLSTNPFSFATNNKPINPVVKIFSLAATSLPARSSSNNEKQRGRILNINYSSLIFIVFLTGLSGYFSPARMAGKKCISPGRKASGALV
jgi:hypothetical protein